MYDAIPWINCQPGDTCGQKKTIVSTVDSVFHPSVDHEPIIEWIEYGGQTLLLGITHGIILISDMRNNEYIVLFYYLGRLIS